MKKLFLMLCLVSLVITADSQGTIKLKITGITPTGGEEVIAFETSDTTLASGSYGTGGGTSIPRFEFVKIKKLKGASTNELFKFSVNGAHTAEMTFEFYDANAALSYTIVIKNVTVNHFSFLKPECTGCSNLYHQVWFDFERIEVTDAATGNVVRYNRSTRVVY